MAGLKCPNCGCTDIESDPVRADSVCTGCGTVVESGGIVSEVTFVDSGGGMSAMGTFVSGDKKGGSNTFGGNFLTGVGREGREVTLKNARSKIVSLCQQLRLRQDHVDMSFHFYKLALNKGMTRGRKSPHVIAACVYITCRTEATGHMLIDISDVLEVDVYQLGRAYLKLSQGLCINIPTMDPCLYVMRYAHKLEFGDSTHEVTMTALRLLSRMKKDWIHLGRRPSGLCGAALLIAARLHEFNRSFEDILKVVKVHESTLRKRLNEFGQTSASQLTLEEFLTADLEAMTEEMDPPCFTAARNKDQELLDREGRMSGIEKEIKRLEEKIEKELEERRSRMKGSRRLSVSSSVGSSIRWSSSSSGSEADEVKCKALEDLDNFLQGEATVTDIAECLDSASSELSRDGLSLDSLLMPPPSPHVVRIRPQTQCSPGLGLKNSVAEYMKPADGEAVAETTPDDCTEDELDLTGINDEEIDSYLMSPKEVKFKTHLWMKVNKEFLKEQEEKVKREKEEREEMIKQGLDPDKKKKVYRKRTYGSSNTAVEAIEKMAVEKKISTKINYDVLKNLSVVPPSPEVVAQSPTKEEETAGLESVPVDASAAKTFSGKYFPTSGYMKGKKMKMEKKPTLVSRATPKKLSGIDVVESSVSIGNTDQVESEPTEVQAVEECLSDMSDEEPLQSAADLLHQQYGGGGDEWGEEDYYY